MNSHGTNVSTCDESGFGIIAVNVMVLFPGDHSLLEVQLEACQLKNGLPILKCPWMNPLSVSKASGNRVKGRELR